MPFQSCKKCGADLTTLLKVKEYCVGCTPEDVESQTTDTQQLKAEIFLGVSSIARDSSIPAVDRLDRIVMFVNEKLSAV